MTAKANGRWTDFVGVARQAVAQVVEADFVGSRVRHVAKVCGAALRREHVLRDVRDGQPEPLIDPAHPARRRGGPDNR